VFFARLSVFVGGCSVEAAQAVCEPDDAFEALAALVDKSLLVGVAGADGEPRFRMLETIRGYAAERLADPSIEADEEATRRRHQDYFCQLARTAEPELLDSSEKTWLDRLEDEHDNLRAAILRAADDGRIELALDTGAALWRFWQQRSHLAEGRALLEGVLARPEAAARTVERARAIGALGGLIYWQGNFPAALETYEESLAIQREHGNPAGVAEELYNAGFTATILDLPDRARACYDEALAIYEAIGDSRGLLRVREALVFLTMKSGDYALGRELQESNLEAFRKAGARFRIANALTQLGSIELFDGRYEKARERYAEGFELFRQASDMPAIVRVTFSSAALANAVGDHLRAAELRGAADTLKAPLGAIALPMQVLGIPDPEIAARQALGDEAYAAAYEAGRRLDLDEIEERIAARARP
jgi:tetratricopeptide (TPR) repeat protein